MRLAGALALALVFVGVAAAGDGGTGTYTSSGDTYDFTALPSAVRVPVIHGRPVVGRVLSATPAMWSKTPTSVRYQWQRCTAALCARISGATRLELRLTRRDALHSVRIVATAAIDGELIQTASKKVAVGRG